MIEVFRRHLSKNKYALEEEVLIKRLMELAGDLGLPLSPSQLRGDASATPPPKQAEDVPAQSTVQRDKGTKGWAAVMGAAATSQARDAGAATAKTRPPVERRDDEVPAPFPAPVPAIPGPSRHAADQNEPKATAATSQQQNDDSVSVAHTAAADTAVDGELESTTPESSHSVPTKEKVQKRVKAIDATAEMTNGGSHVSKRKTPKADSSDVNVSVTPAASFDTDGAANPGKGASSVPAEVHHGEGGAALQPKLPKPKPTPEGDETGATRPRSASSASEIGGAVSARASIEASLDATSSSLTDQIMAEAMEEAMAEAKNELKSEHASPAPEILVHGPADL